MASKWNRGNRWPVEQNVIALKVSYRPFYDANVLRLNWWIKGLLAIILFFSLSCVGLKKQPSPQKKSPVASSKTETTESVHPNYEGQIHDSQGVGLEGKETQEPKDIKIEATPKVGLILGPGGVKTWAQTGVIRELIKKRIPLDYIVGIEWGALVGGLFARKGEIHDVEWKLYKLKKKDIVSEGLFSNSSASYPISNLINYFKKDIGKLQMSSLQVPMSCPSLSIQSGVTSWQRKGKLSTVLGKCMAFPPMFKPHRQWVSAVFSFRESVEFLKARGMDVIIFVNVMDRGELLEASYMKQNPGAAVLWQELRRYLNRHVVGEADVELINVPTKNIKIYDFESHRLLVAAGGRAGRRAADRLIQKYGF